MEFWRLPPMLSRHLLQGKFSLLPFPSSVLAARLVSRPTDRFEVVSVDIRLNIEPPILRRLYGPHSDDVW